MMSRGMKIAMDNCYVRDMFRTYIKYNGQNAREVKHTYRMVEFTPDEYMSDKKPDKVEKGAKYKYELDDNGNKITKYLEYLVDGRQLKSFGTTLEEGLIMPMTEKGYVQLYIV